MPVDSDAGSGRDGIGRRAGKRRGRTGTAGGAATGTSGGSTSGTSGDVPTPEDVAAFKKEYPGIRDDDSLGGARVHCAALLMGLVYLRAEVLRPVSLSLASNFHSSSHA